MKKATNCIATVVVALWICTVGWSGPVSAGEKSLKVSIREAVGIALKNNQDYRIAVFRMKQARHKVNSVWGQLMPILESEASLTRQYAENGFISLSDGQYDIKFIQMKFGINPGMFYNSLIASKKTLKAAKEEVRRIRSDLEFRVITIYFNLLLADEMIKLRRDSVQFYRSNLNDVKNLYRTGSVPRFELLQAQVQLKNQEPLLLEAENTYRITLDTFNYTLGNGGVRHTVDRRALKEDVLPVPNAVDPAILQRLSRIALKNRPEIMQLENKKEIAVHSKRVQSSHYLWPTFSIGGSYGITRYMPNTVDLNIPAPINPDLSRISGTDEWQNTWQVRIAATYRWSALLPADSVRGLEREEQLKIREAEEELVKLKRLIAISINSSYSRLVTSYLTIQSQKDNVETAKEGLRIARESYRAGVLKNSDLLSAELSLTNARTSYINALNSYYTALAELKRDTGVENDTIILHGDKK